MGLSRNQPIKNSIAVLPELSDDDISQCYEFVQISL